MVAKSRFDRVSPSSLPEAEQCLRSWAISRDYKAAQKVHPDLPDDGASVPMVFGSAFHKAVEDKAGTLKEIRKSVDSVLGKSDPHYDAVYKGRDDLARGVGVALKAFVSDPVSKPWKDGSARHIEGKLEGEVDGVPMVGIVDCVDGDGHVIDLKTTTPKADSEYGSQLTAYWLLAKANMEGVVGDASVLKVFRPYGPKGSSGTRQEYMSAEANEKHVRTLIGKVWKIGQERDKWKENYREIPSNPGARRCRYCNAKGTSACPETRRW